MDPNDKLGIFLLAAPSSRLRQVASEARAALETLRDDLDIAGNQLYEALSREAEQKHEIPCRRAKALLAALADAVGRETGRRHSDDGRERLRAVSAALRAMGKRRGGLAATARWIAKRAEVPEKLAWAVIEALAELAKAPTDPRTELWWETWDAPAREPRSTAEDDQIKFVSPKEVERRLAKLAEESYTSHLRERHQALTQNVVGLYGISGRRVPRLRAKKRAAWRAQDAGDWERGTDLAIAADLEARRAALARVEMSRQGEIETLERLGALLREEASEAYDSTGFYTPDSARALRRAVAELEVRLGGEPAVMERLRGEHSQTLREDVHATYQTWKATLDDTVARRRGFAWIYLWDH